MARVHVISSQVASQTVEYTLDVDYTTYDVLTNPCLSLEEDKSLVLASAGLATTLTWVQCTMMSYSLSGGRHRYNFEVKVSS